MNAFSYLLACAYFTAAFISGVFFNYPLHEWVYLGLAHMAAAKIGDG
jgi:hypothetical protein